MTTFWRWTLLVHRYLGIGVGIVVFVWCASGIVMMYVPYPSISPEEQLVGLSNLQLEKCCDPAQLDASSTVLSVDGFVVEQVTNHLVIRATLTNSEQVRFDLRSGTELRSLDRQDLISTGLQIGAYNQFENGKYLEDVDMDQWTVHGRFNRHRPMLLFEDDNATQWYVSGSTGELVQATQRSERFWNWLGSVTHWLYPTALRKDTALWAQVVIWLTIISLFLTATGIIFGLKQYRYSGLGRRSPYSGWSLWHHYSGLIFGLFTLTWLISGFFSMNPWGLLEGRSFAAEQVRLQGGSISLGQGFTFLHNVAPHIPEGTVRLQSVITDQALSVVAYDNKGTKLRLDELGAVDSLTEVDALALAGLLRPDKPLANLAYLQQADDYYYDHHVRKTFPIWRMSFEDGEKYYLDPLTAQMVLYVDRDRIWYRWLFNAFHTGDFHWLARTRPLWDSWMLILLGGLTIGAGTGVVLGWRRLTKPARIGLKTATSHSQRRQTRGPASPNLIDPGSRRT